MKKNRIDELFTYHNPSDIDPNRFTAIREAAKSLAYTINEMGGDESEKRLAIYKLRECVFYAIASIVLPQECKDGQEN